MDDLQYLRDRFESYQKETNRDLDHVRHRLDALAKQLEKISPRIDVEKNIAFVEVALVAAKKHDDLLEAKIETLRKSVDGQANDTSTKRVLDSIEIKLANLAKMGVGITGNIADMVESKVTRISTSVAETTNNLAKSLGTQLDAKIAKVANEIQKLQRGSVGGIDEKKTIALITSATASLPALQVQITDLRKRIDNLAKTAKR